MGPQKKRMPIKQPRLQECKGILRLLSAAALHHTDYDFLQYQRAFQCWWLAVIMGLY